LEKFSLCEKDYHWIRTIVEKLIFSVKLFPVSITLFQCEIEKFISKKTNPKKFLKSRKRAFFLILGVKVTFSGERRDIAEIPLFILT
jgi:hypothetical protein